MNDTMENIIIKITETSSLPTGSEYLANLEEVREMIVAEIDYSDKFIQLMNKIS